MIPQAVKDEIRKQVNHGGIAPTLRQHINGMIYCWEMDGFSSKLEAERAYENYETACWLRHWCRQNGFTTRKGTFHLIDANRYSDLLGRMVKYGMSGAECDGIRWELAQVDYLRNAHIWFMGN
jgi:hypothetical protein